MDDVRPLYGRHAWAYEALVANPAGPDVAQIAGHLAELGPPTEITVVDAGCGAGRFSEGLSGMGFRVLGLDRSEALIEQARLRGSGVEYLCHDLLTWSTPAPVDAVLSRGVLNDLITDADRAAAFGAFGSWLRPGGLLIADVRDWARTEARYADASVRRRTVTAGGRTLRFETETTLDADRHRMLVRERYLESPGGDSLTGDCPTGDSPTGDPLSGDPLSGDPLGPKEQTYDFEMRCWTAEELRAEALSAGFSQIRVRPGPEADIAADRLLLLAGR